MQCNKFPFEELQQHFKAAIPVALNAMGNDAVNFILDNFQKQGFQGATFDKWPDRKNNKYSKGRAILVKSARLKRGWRATTNAAALSTKISNDVPYAKVHNEGGEIQHGARQQVLHFKKSGNISRFSKEKHATHAQKVSVGAHTVMPKRQMMGDSPVLRKKVMTTLANTFSKAVNL
jgi:phage gpG-like protein